MRTENVFDLKEKKKPTQIEQIRFLSGFAVSFQKCLLASTLFPWFILFPACLLIITRDVDGLHWVNSLMICKHFPLLFSMVLLLMDIWEIFVILLLNLVSQSFFFSVQIRH